MSSRPLSYLALALALAFAVPAASASAADGDATATAAPTPIIEFRHEVVNAFPHDRGAFTQGLLYRDGFLYESTGLHGRSGVRKVVLETGTVIQQRSLEKQYFGEGLADWNNSLIQITWQNRTGFVFDINTLEPRRSFGYEGEGWGLTHDGRRLIMSDGTPTLRFLDPETQRETGRVTVTYEGTPLRGLNELEMVDGALWANVWGSEWIVRIDADSGRVTGRANLAGLLPAEERGRVDVLNGIAWDAQGKRLFVTGKLWPTLFEIRLLEAAAEADRASTQAAKPSQAH